MRVKTGSKYVYPFNDFAFKKLFGRNTSKLFLVDLLNALINPEKRIVSIKFLNTEKLGRTKESRKSVFDIFCEDEDGNKFIIEIQKVLKPYFFDRSLYYSSMAIQDHAVKGKWDFNIKKTYTICLIDDCFDKENPDQVVHVFKLVDIETHKMQEQLIIYNIELPKFKKTEKQLVARLDVWLYVLNNLTNFEDIPEFLKDDPIFKLFFMEAEIANYNREEYWAYQAAMEPIWEANRTKALNEQLKKEARRIKEEKNYIKKETEKINKTKDQLKKDAAELKKGTAELKKDAAELKKGTAELKKDAAGLKKDAAELKKGTAELKKYTAELNKRKDQLRKEAEQKFEEGIETVIKAIQLKKARASIEEIAKQTSLPIERILQL